jgi:hypothetical protein
MKDTKSFLYEIDVLTIVSSNLNCIQIQLKTNGMQNDEKRFKIFLWIWCWILLFLKTQIQKDTLPCLFNWEWTKQIPSMTIYET